MGFFKKLFGGRKKEFAMFSPEVHEDLLNEDLQRAIEALAAENSPTNRRKLYEILLEITYCLPLSDKDDADKDDADPDSQTVTAVQNAEGELALVVFSDPAALQRWTGKAQSMLVVTADKMLQIVLDNNFAEIQLNPAGPAGGKLGKYECGLLAQGIFPE